LADGAVLAPALTHGQMLEAAAVTAADNVLVIATNGYLAAVTAQLAGSVSIAATVAAAQTGPYSLILIDGAAEVLPDALAGLLADDGRLVTGLVDRGIPRLATARKAGGKVIATALGDADFAVLPEFTAAKQWSF
ncbi:MAG: hypothetical protein RIS85_2095, partial [Pseudomonadota bacterium]